MFLDQNISVYINFNPQRVVEDGGGLQDPPYIFCLLFTKIETVQNRILHHFDFLKKP